MIIKVEEVCKKELVTLLSTALFGNNWLSCYAPREEKHLAISKEPRCFEEVLADRLLAGGHIVFIDENDEDENGDTGKEYKVDLEQVKRGIEKSLMMSNDWYEVQEGYGDITNAENIIQRIIFGKVIYG